MYIRFVDYYCSKNNRGNIPSNLLYKPHLNRQYNCWSLRCSWNIARRRCSNCIFILDLTLGFNGLGNDNCKTRRETFKFGDLVRHILEVRWYRYMNYNLMKHQQLQASVHVYLCYRITVKPLINIRRTLVGNKTVDRSDAVGASPVGAAPTASSFSTWHLASRDSAKKAARQYENI